jgi:hypothetical protein
LSTIASQIARAEFVSQRSLERHLQQRVEEEQWSTATSSADYLDDLRSLASGAHTLLVYERRGGGIAALIASTALLYPANRAQSPGQQHRRVLDRPC